MIKPQKQIRLRRIKGFVLLSSEVNEQTFRRDILI